MMIHIEKVEKAYPGLVQEMRFLAGDCLLNQGSLSGLQKSLGQEKYLDEIYIREKIQSTIKTLEGIERDLKIAESIENDKFPNL